MTAGKQFFKVRWKKMHGLWVDSRDMYLSLTGLLMFQKVYLLPPVRFFLTNQRQKKTQKICDSVFISRQKY